MGLVQTPAGIPKAFWKLNTSLRICLELWSVSELLLRTRAVQRKQTYTCCWDFVHWYCLPRRSNHYTNCQALAKMAQIHDLVWLGTVNSRLASRKFRQEHRILDCDTGYYI